MNHTLSKVKVYQSTEYKRFRNISGNRGINKKKIERIVAEINSGNDVLDENPILVTETNGHLDIKDGQHRFLVAEKLKRPVHYIIKKDDMSLYNIAKVNSNTEKWKADDFINCYVAAGNKNYVQLKKYRDEYGIAVGPCLSILTYGIQKHDGTIVNLYKDFELGKFEIKKYKEAVQFAEICKGFSTHSGWNRRPFLIALSKVINGENCEMDVLLKKFNEDPKRLSYHADWKGYINNLEEIYNKGNSKRRVIY